ncbi:transmembrane protein 198-like isoform X2 [Glandiceps talaboti]
MAAENGLDVVMTTKNQDTSSEFPNNPLLKCENLDFSSYSIAPAVICALAFVFGIVFCFFGYRCFKAVLFLVGFIFGSILVYAICQEEAVLNLAANAGISLAAGLLCGLITMLVQYVGLFMTGFHMGLFLAAAVLVAMEQFWHPTSIWIPIGILFGVGLLFALINLQWQKTCTILATSLIGGAMITTSADFFIEKFYMVQYVWDRFTAKPDSEPVCWFSWIILAVWPILFLFGVVIQFKITGKNYDHHDVVVRSPKKKRVELAKIRQREAQQTKHRKYRYLYKVRRYNGDIVSQAYLQSIQSHLSPEMKKMASKTHLPTTPSETQLQVDMMSPTAATSAHTNIASV